MSFFGAPTTPVINSFNIGTDLISLTIRDNATGVQVLLDGKKNMFTSEAADTVDTSQPIDYGGLTDNRVISSGWTGSVRCDRANGNFSAYYAFLEQNFYSNGVQHYCTVTATVQSADGTSVERAQFQNVVFHGYKPGDYEKLSRTQSEVSWRAQQRVLL